MKEDPVSKPYQTLIHSASTGSKEEGEVGVQIQVHTHAHTFWMVHVFQEYVIEKLN